MWCGKLRAPLAAALVGLLSVVAAPIEAAPGTIAPAVASALRSAGPGERIAVIVTLSDQVDLRTIDDTNRNQRRARLVTTLRRHAARTQAPLIAALQAAGARRITPLWINNSVAAALPAQAVEGLADLPGVAGIRLDETVNAPVTTLGTVAPVEWNIDAIGAPGLWDLGFTGQGTVVANMDTGVDSLHPDLNSRWRGGTNSWFDPYGQHATPYDPAGHGTQTMGLIVGGEAGGTSIGVAPGAQWIAVKIFDDAGQALLSKIHEGFQSLLDPDGDPGTDDAPDVVNNSWGFAQNPGECILEFQPDIDTLKTAGIAVVFSAGNNGPAGATDESPANNPSGLAAGSVDDTLTVSSFSSRGPSACDTTVFPELVAPGDNVQTTDLSAGGMPFYASVFGTSFAAPHIAGAMALLRSAFPNASVAELETALQSTTLDGGPAGPDNDYGHGLIDVLEAYNFLVATPPGEVDADGDGYPAGSDCNDNDPTVYPGAPETKHDGIDQDCNGYDLTIDIVKAAYDAGKDKLDVEATSTLAGAAQLEVVGYGSMSWNSRKGKWSLSVAPAGGDPLTVIVNGIEGSESGPTTSGGKGGGGSGGGGGGGGKGGGKK